MSEPRSSSRSGRVAVGRVAVGRERDLRRAIGRQLLEARLESGASQASVARAAGIDRAHLCRIEAGAARPSTLVLVHVAAALGAELSVRLFTGVGPRIVDRVQAPMVEALLRMLDRRWVATPEVPVVAPARGVVHVVLHDPGAGLLVACEVHSQIRRLEQQIRWIAEKELALPSSVVARSAASLTGSMPATSRLLVLRSTTANRDLARRFFATLAAAFPARSSEAVAALRGDAAWPGPAIVWVRVERGTATPLDGPPRGVALGK